MNFYVNLPTVKNVQVLERSKAVRFLREVTQDAGVGIGLRVARDIVDSIQNAERLEVKGLFTDDPYVVVRVE